METKSIEQLEKDVWKNPSEFSTYMIEKCYRYRKISIVELTNEQIRLLISQQIGTEYLIGIALEKLERNILTECDFYEGDLLVTVSGLPTEFWNRKKTEFLTFKNLVEQNYKLIKSELGEKKFDKLLNRIGNGYKNVCFDCRKAFNQGTDFNNIRESKCPECGNLMTQVTHRFRPPKQNEVKKWNVAKFLMDNGFLYHHVWQKVFKNEKGEIYALANYAEYPQSMREAKEFVEKYKEQAINE